MKRLTYKQMKFLKLKCMLLGNRRRTEYLKKTQIFAMFGEHNYYCTKTIPEEPYLVKIHNNVVIAADVKFITHDVMNDMLSQKMNTKPGVLFSEYQMGTIEIFDNVAIGLGAIILPNTKIGPNAIIAAGSIVTKDVPEGSIVGGNPARVIGTVEQLIEKRKLQKDFPINRDSIDTIMDFYWKDKI